MPTKVCHGMLRQAACPTALLRILVRVTHVVGPDDGTKLAGVLAGRARVPAVTPAAGNLDDGHDRLLPDRAGRGLALQQAGRPGLGALGGGCVAAAQPLARD